MTTAPDPAPALADLTIDTLRAEDAEQLNALVNAAAVADGTGETESVASTREFLATPGVDLATDTIAVRHGDRLLAFGGVELPVALTHDGRARARLGGEVLPEERRRGIGTLVLDRLETRASQLAAERHPGAPAYLEASGGLEGNSVRHLLEGRGYRNVRSYFEMERRLAEPVGEFPAPEGFRLVAPDREHAEATREAHNTAFADHWGSAPIDAERWEQLWTSHTARPALSSIALDAGGRVVGYVIGQEWEPRELYIALVGAVPDARGKGLARALIARTLRATAATGEYDTADLGVDAESLTGATRLYEALGFRTQKIFASYQRDLPTT